MNKLKFFYLLVMFAIVLIVFLCNKSKVIASSNLPSNNDELKDNKATWIYSNQEHLKNWYLKIVIKIGHTAADCGNKCVKIFGELGHIDCRGFGNICNHIINTYVVQSGENFKLVLKDPDALGVDLDFSIPNRTLYITNPQNNTDLWLNMPEQVLLRDNNKVPFVIQNIWFSEKPELENKYSFYFFSEKEVYSS